MKVKSEHFIYRHLSDVVNVCIDLDIVLVIIPTIPSGSIE